MTAIQSINYEIRRPGITRIIERVRSAVPQWPEWRVIEEAKQQWEWEHVKRSAQHAAS